MDSFLLRALNNFRLSCALYIDVVLCLFSPWHIFGRFSFKSWRRRSPFLDSLTSELEDGCSKSLGAKRWESTIYSGSSLHRAFDLRLTITLNPRRGASWSPSLTWSKERASCAAGENVHGTLLPCFWTSRKHRASWSNRETGSATNSWVRRLNKYRNLPWVFPVYVMTVASVRIELHTFCCVRNSVLLAFSKSFSFWC